LFTNLINKWFNKYNSYESQLSRFKKIKHEKKDICIKKISLDQINPYDYNHDIENINKDKDHLEGIDMVKELIISGETLLPVLVKSFKSKSYSNYCGYQYNLKKGLNTNFKYQRLDGFKRYFAFKELGHHYIECIIDDNSFPGGQHKMNWILNNEEDMILEYLFIQTVGTKIFDIRR